MIEISLDHGQTWKDVSAYGINPGYGGQLTDGETAQNPLKGRNAYVGASDKWPKWSAVELPFGTQFANQKVLLRFRVGTDQAVGAHGWELDNLEFSGIQNTPFAVLIEDQGSCSGIGPGVGTIGPGSSPSDSTGGCHVGLGGGALWLVFACLGLAGRRRRD